MTSGRPLRRASARSPRLADASGRADRTAALSSAPARSSRSRDPFTEHIDAIRGKEPKTALIPNGTLDQFFEDSGRNRLGVPDDRYLVTFAGTLGIAQALPSTLDAAAQLVGEADFSYVGDGPMKDIVVEQAQELGLGTSTSTLRFRSSRSRPCSRGATPCSSRSPRTRPSRASSRRSSIDFMAVGRPGPARGGRRVRADRRGVRRRHRRSSGGSGSTRGRGTASARRSVRLPLRWGSTDAHLRGRVCGQLRPSGSSRCCSTSHAEPLRRSCRRSARIPTARSARETLRPYRARRSSSSARRAIAWPVPRCRPT